tara:strand:- start:4435 stop:5763 length:1329 start_codon:yes stop_codon:yes gene_type:complete
MKLHTINSVRIMVLVAATCGIVFFWWSGNRTPAPWTDREAALIASIWLGNLPSLPPDPSNAVADDPRAARLGHRLFFDTRLSINGEIACATCHQPTRQFTDGLPVGEAIDRAKRNTPSIIGAAYSPWQYWDGRKDSLWAQALSPLEDAAEHGGNRMSYARLISSDPHYQKEYTKLFGMAPDFSDPERFPVNAGPVGNSEWQAAWDAMDEEDRALVNGVFANIGKLIAAYERKLIPGPARFDAYAETVMLGQGHEEQDLFSEEEIRGLRLFMGEARCMECHNGPLLTNSEFHNTGLLPPTGQVPDRGRSRIIAELNSDPFNCLGRFSDTEAGQCEELTYMRTGVELIGAMKTPSLRNLEHTAPYMHKGQFMTLSRVLEHYNEAPLALIGHNEAEPLGLNRRQLEQIEAYLRTLFAPPAVEEKWLHPPPLLPEASASSATLQSR